MNSILMMAVMLILWTGTDEPMWKCVLLSAVFLFSFFLIRAVFFDTTELLSMTSDKLSLTWRIHRLKCFVFL